ncbi:MAG: cupredoxin domain-containing protein [Candidatus Jorgensenbacteria bacterium]|nr:cupredoxin domain-containing protein [Candidatus Jorgensenbacteria bacterium]
MEENKTTIIWIIIGVVAAVAVLALVIFTRWTPAGNNLSSGTVVPGGGMPIATPGTTLPGISQVKGGEVITESGKTAQNNAAPGSADAPKQSVVVGQGSIPPTAIKITASSKGFSPSTFEVRSGSVVTLAVTSLDGQSYLFAFDDSSLSAVTVGVPPGQSRVINFNAPAPGVYDFRSAVPGQAAQGLVGKMTVK